MGEQMSDLEEKLEEKIDEKIEQLHKDDSEIDREKLKKEIMRELEEEGEERKQNILENLREKTVSRREFLKALGIGAGGLALASPVSGAWANWIASSQGKSDIDADTVDGKEASELGGGGTGFYLYLMGTYSNDNSGTIKYGAEATGSAKFKLGINSGVSSGQATIKKDGNTLTTSASSATTLTSYTSADTITFKFSGARYSALFYKAI